AVLGVAVVALLRRELQTVAAHRGAGAAGAVGLDGARRRAAVVRDQVVIVALLAAFLDPVAAGRLPADVVLAQPAGLHRAGRGAPEVHPVVVAELALLVPGDDAVAALLGDARAVRGRARPAVLDLAGRRAAVEVDGVAVVALLVAADPAVAAH